MNTYRTLQLLLKNPIIPLAVILIVGAPDMAVGQTPVNPDSTLQAILGQIEGAPLSLQQATQHALNNATAVRKAEAAYLAAGGSLRKESGLFDPVLFFSMSHQDQEQPTASFFSGAPILVSEQTTSRTGLRWDLPIGTELEVALNTVGLKSNSQFAFLNPQYNSFGTLSIRQSLLGGFAASARRQLSRAEHASEAEKSRYDQQVLAVSAEVERNYWDLYAAERDYAVQTLVREQAELFLRETELRANAGLIGPNQVANAKTFLAEQELLLLDREEQLDRHSDQLASLMGVRPEAGSPRFIAVDEPPNEFPVEPVDMLVRRAVENNLTLQAAREDVEAMRSLANAARWEVLPRVDLVGSLGGTGLSGTAQDVIFGSDTLRTTRSGSFGDAVLQTRRREFPSWSVGVEVSIPIGFRSGLGESDRLDAEVVGAEQRFLEQARVLEEQVRGTHRELYHGKRRLAAALEGVKAAEEQGRIGLIEFHNGRSTAFELVRLGADFAMAQRRYSEALVRSAKAAATLRQLTSGGYPSNQ